MKLMSLLMGVFAVSVWAQDGARQGDEFSARVICGESRTSVMLNYYVCSEVEFGPLEFGDSRKLNTAEELENFMAGLEGSLDHFNRAQERSREIIGLMKMAKGGIDVTMDVVDIVSSATPATRLTGKAVTMAIRIVNDQLVGGAIKSKIKDAHYKAQRIMRSTLVGQQEGFAQQLDNLQKLSPEQARLEGSKLVPRFKKALRNQATNEEDRKLVDAMSDEFLIEAMMGELLAQGSNIEMNRAQIFENLRDIQALRELLVNFQEQANDEFEKQAQFQNELLEKIKNHSERLGRLEDKLSFISSHIFNQLSFEEQKVALQENYFPELELTEDDIKKHLKVLDFKISLQKSSTAALYYFMGIDLITDLANLAGARPETLQTMSTIARVGQSLAQFVGGIVSKDPFAVVGAIRNLLSGFLPDTSLQRHKQIIEGLNQLAGNQAKIMDGVNEVFKKTLMLLNGQKQIYDEILNLRYDVLDLEEKMDKNFDLVLAEIFNNREILNQLLDGDLGECSAIRNKKSRNALQSRDLNGIARLEPLIYSINKDETSMIQRCFDALVGLFEKVYGDRDEFHRAFGFERFTRQDVNESFKMDDLYQVNYALAQYYQRESGEEKIITLGANPIMSLKEEFSPYTHDLGTKLEELMGEYLFSPYFVKNAQFLQDIVPLAELSHFYEMGPPGNFDFEQAFHAQERRRFTGVVKDALMVGQVMLAQQSLIAGLPLLEDLYEDLKSSDPEWAMVEKMRSLEESYKLTEEFSQESVFQEILKTVIREKSSDHGDLNEKSLEDLIAMANQLVETPIELDGKDLTVIAKEQVDQFRAQLLKKREELVFAKVSFSKLLKDQEHCREIFNEALAKKVSFWESNRSEKLSCLLAYNPYLQRNFLYYALYRSFVPERSYSAAVYCAHSEIGSCDYFNANYPLPGFGVAFASSDLITPYLQKHLKSTLEQLERKREDFKNHKADNAEGNLIKDAFEQYESFTGELSALLAKIEKGESAADILDEEKNPKLYKFLALSAQGPLHLSTSLFANEMFRSLHLAAQGLARELSQISKVRQYANNENKALQLAGQIVPIPNHQEAQQLRVLYPQETAPLLQVRETLLDLLTLLNLDESMEEGERQQFNELLIYSSAKGI